MGLYIPSKKNAPKIAPIGAGFQAAATKNRRLFGANITPKTRQMHAEKVHFSAPNRRRFGANFQAPIRCQFKGVAAIVGESKYHIKLTN